MDVTDGQILTHKIDQRKIKGTFPIFLYKDTVRLPTYAKKKKKKQKHSNTVNIIKKKKHFQNLNYVNTSEIDESKTVSWRAKPK